MGSIGKRIFFGSIVAAFALGTIGCSGNSIRNNIVPLPDTFNNAVELVSYMRVGWNLGNTLDTTNLSWLGENPAVTQLETAWGNPVTTRENITTIANAGFNIIRIPVSWNKAVDSNFEIRRDWMERVKEVVDFAVDTGVFIILNSHHDENIFKFTNEEMETSLAAYQKIWEQIAYTFKDYDERLIFEGLNEPRTMNSPHEWTGGNNEERTNLNIYYQLFVDIIRASGGKNDKRFLMLNTYAASPLQAPINSLVIPNDSVPDRIIVSFHSYTPFSFALSIDPSHNYWSRYIASDTAQITDAISRAYYRFVAEGIPVVIGELRAMNKDNEEARARWAEFYVRYAMDRGMPCLWWDNGIFAGQPNEEKFGLLDRTKNTFPFPQIITALMDGSAR